MRKILIVDDEPGIRNFLKILLQEDGFFVKEANNGLEALVELRSHHFDLMVTDINMPQMNGIELITKIHEMKLLTKVIVMTGGGLMPKHKSIPILNEIEVDFIIEKPFCIDSFLGLVKELIA